MMRQQTTLFAKMGDLGGGADAARQLLSLVMTAIMMRRRRKRMTTVVRLWEEKEGEWECKNQIHHRHYHWDKGGREDLTIATPGRDDTHTNSAMCARTWSWRTYNWQLEREEVQRRMRWKIMEEECSWEEERIAVRIAAMLMGMGMGTDMGMGNTDAMMRS